MKVKKFTCKRCLAPKITKIETAYVVCDYCASLMDVDATTGVKEYYQDTDRATYYEQSKFKLEALSEDAYKEGDQALFIDYRNQFWTMYLDTYPEFILPTLSRPSLIEEWCTLCAKIDAFHRFQENTDTEIAKQEEANEGIQFYQKGENQYAEWDSFILATKMYYDTLENNLKEMREVPEFNLLNKVFPLDIAIKKEMSTYAQIWIPYLEEKHHEPLLEYLGLKTEYIDIPPVKIKQKPCENCNETIEVPEGAITSKCNHCNTDNTWTKVTCTGCGAKNELPEDWQETITCAYCTVETRVVNRLFG